MLGGDYYHTLKDHKPRFLLGSGVSRSSNIMSAQFYIL